MIGERMNEKTFTLRKLYENGEELLQNAGIEEAKLDAWYLLEYVTGIGRASYYGEPERTVPLPEAREYLELIRRRCGHVPLQHLTGEQEFMGLSFLVNPHVLIPRQDTETLVEEALRFAEPGMKVLDLCTGSGCILISLLKLCPDLEGEGLDISKEALEVARKNARRLGVKARFRESDLLECAGKDYDMLVSNPPYIRTSVIRELQEEVRLYDPWIALDGKEDGLYFYRRIIADSIRVLKPGGMLLFEIGYDQGREVAELMQRHGYTKIQIKKDLAGLDRVVSGMYNKD